MERIRGCYCYWLCNDVWTIDTDFRWLWWTNKASEVIEEKTILVWSDWGRWSHETRCECTMRLLHGVRGWYGGVMYWKEIFESSSWWEDPFGFGRNLQVEWSSLIISSKKIQGNNNIVKEGVVECVISVWPFYSLLNLVDWSLCGCGPMDVGVRTEPRYHFLVSFIFLHYFPALLSC